MSSDLRKRQTKKDEVIRQKMEKDLAKKRPTAARSRTASRKATPGTVSSLKPTPPMTVPADMTVHEAAQLMAAKREDCVLVISDESHLSGIFTAKDLAFRVVSQGKNPSHTPVSEIMTPNPMCTRVDTSATEALDLMVTRGFRHLPVVDEEGDVSGVLDITKCFYEAMEKLERAYASSKKLYEALEGVQTEMGGSQQPAQIIEYVETLRQKMSGPELAGVLDGTPPTWVTVKTSVREATTLMRENHTTAVLVMDGDKLAGIFTSKDVVLRVIAPGLDSGVCSVVRVMTPHPDCAPQHMSIQDALRKMNDGHYLNLPVTDEEDTIIGMVDVLKLTYATLEQVHSMNTAGDEGPMWNKFWTSVGGAGEEDSASAVSGSDVPSTRHSTTNRTGSRQAITPGGLDRPQVINPFTDTVSPLPITHEEYDSPVRPGDSISAHQDSDNPFDTAVPFAFKFKTPAGKIHRLAFAVTSGLAPLREALVEKLSTEDRLTLTEEFGISYVDDDGDIVSITCHEDLLESVKLAKRAKRDKVELYLHHPDQVAVTTPAVPLQQQPRLSRAVSGLSSHVDAVEAAPAAITASAASAPEKEVETHSEKRSSPAQGSTNDLLIPGALVVLAIAIVGVFAVSRASK
ncbi:hypothetical protein BCR37DRAFT_378970 [Protomyces lactucae-debilis]|uniref:CBS-domain-containing protein n=1 Tax=Protomyces lactucae-debilis TaxID=2754530 RepID=A0A1Y2FGI0_PROLT|nr:uncharacterized protein BCR37DRAFT_378970 [Protomyces lactucae-debilis]ORY83032.1 hypothetical protein BCR37DRAFT_378970 [Protomyces lactucae-debilis]